MRIVVVILSLGFLLSSCVNSTSELPQIPPEKKSTLNKICYYRCIQDRREAKLCNKECSGSTSELPHASPKDVGMSEEKVSKIQDVVEEVMALGKLQGAVIAVARRGLKRKDFTILRPKSPSGQTGCSIWRHLPNRYWALPR